MSLSDTVTARDELNSAIAAFERQGRMELITSLQKTMASILSVGIAQLDAALDIALPLGARSDFYDAQQALLNGAPLSKVIRSRAFWESDFFINKNVLDPRPDTETLVEAALQVPFTRVLDLGTGSGCILISLLNARRDATGLGTDLSAEALQVARRNVQDAGCAKAAALVRSDWFAQVEGRFDLIVSNPPYIDAATYETLDDNVRNYDPKIALTPGATGLEAYEVIIPRARDYLSQNGHLMVEIGHDQSRSVSALFDQAGFADIEVVRDINSKDRVVRAILR